ncbi:hypothetical protein KPSA1_02451 [Pseudomonas syringae pv. actinidiae]|uniref:Uncharacterized protein n=1 Tax=Pseudomonas syringae pv. actinidiae TaxID=103796 RepID=A0A2V0Q979_PSESF|nr:hypothetical protein KPSA1_02451 [Pseudomonas syringae pv. actinidiae]
MPDLPALLEILLLEPGHAQFARKSLQAQKPSGSRGVVDRRMKPLPA